MSDAPTTGGLTTDAVPAGVTASAPASPQATEPAPPAGTTATPPVTAPPDPLAELPADRAVFDRGYVESLRTEGAKFRTRANEVQAQLARYDDVFGQYEEPDQAVWLDLARTWATDPAKAAALMQQIAGNVLDEVAAGAGSAGASSPGGEPQRLNEPAVEQLTPEKVQELIDQQFSAREAKAAEAQAVEAVYGEVRTAGFDPNSAEGFMVLWNANHFTNGDITKAVEMTNSYKQSIIDGYVQGRSSGSFPMPTAANGAPATGNPEPIRNLEDAKKATDAFLRERRSAS